MSDTRRMATSTPEAGREPRDALIDAAERLLIDVGYAGITTRRVAETAGVNHGLVHYYFGSMEELFLQTLERFTGRLVEAQRGIFAGDMTFREKWAAHVAFMNSALTSGYGKIWFELQAMGWNRPAMQERLRWVHQQWVEMLVPFVEQAVAEHGADVAPFTSEAIASLVCTASQGAVLERLTGADSGHDELFATLERWLTGPPP